MDRQGYDVGTSHRLLRKLEGLEGEVELALEFKPTFDYARAHTEVEWRTGGAIAYGAARYLTLACPEIESVADGRGG